MARHEEEEERKRFVLTFSQAKKSFARRAMGEATEQLEAAMGMAKKLNMAAETRACCKWLGDAFLLSGNFRKAREYHKMYEDARQDKEDEESESSTRPQEQRTRKGSKPRHLLRGEDEEQRQVRLTVSPGLDGLVNQLLLRQMSVREEAEDVRTGRHEQDERRRGRREAGRGRRGRVRRLHVASDATGS
eukprot:752321-Hanusia_phi.AAC.3